MSGGVPAGWVLVPCPKCGREGYLRTSNDGDVEWIRCTSCPHEGPVHWTAEKAIAAWNTRATPTPPSRDADVERFCNPIVTCVDDEVYVLFDAPDQSIAPFCMDRDHAQALLTALTAAIGVLGEGHSANGDVQKDAVKTAESTRP